MKTTILPRIDELKNNSVGNKENDKSRNLAIKSLNNVKIHEVTKLKNGFIWVVKDKMSKLIGPDKLKQSILDRFKPLKKTK